MWRPNASSEELVLSFNISVDSGNEVRVPGLCRSPFPVEPSRQPQTCSLCVHLSVLLGSGLQEPTFSLQAVTQGPYSVLFILNFKALWARMSSEGMFVS